MEKRILIIDNDQASVAPLKAELEQQGYLVEVIEDSEMGLQQIMKEPPDLVVIGTEQTGMHDVEVIKAIRADNNTRNLPVIVYAFIENDEAYFPYWKSGVDAVLSKPDRSAEVVKLTNRIFEAQTEPSDYMPKIT